MTDMQYERPHIEESRSLEAVLTWGPKGKGKGKRGRSNLAQCCS